MKEWQAIARPDLTRLQVEEAQRAFESANFGRRVRVEARLLDARELPGGYFLQLQLPHMTRPVWLPAPREAALAARKGQPVVALATLRGLRGMALEPELDDLRYLDLPGPGLRASPPAGGQGR
ncbi:MAG: hypothetical protein VKQ33_09070 [Candidatus Sericytochromatia bacterium]|nr:hypothetical protein [Candidatus Sericytochromatia bacterium]